MTPLEEMLRLRDFLAMVSHELRTPLTTIKGSAATVLSTSTPFDPIETRRFFRIIDRQADLMSELVSNLLDVTRIEAGALMVTPKRTDIKDLVEEAISTFLRNGSRNRIEVDLQPELPAIAADPQRVTQVLDNLLSNASKYSPASSDSGDGIAEGASPGRLHHRRGSWIAGGPASPFVQEVLPDIRPEWRGEHPRRSAWASPSARVLSRRTGAAFGPRAMMGAVRDSPLRFRWPPTRRATQIKRPQSRAGSRTGDQARILSVDDNPQILRYVRNVLMDAGHIPIVTGNPNEMVHLLEMEQPRLVLLDLILPGTNGFELMKRIREISSVPVIFLSGSGEEENIVRALEMGAADYIVKPFSPTELVARIGSALRKSAGRSEAEERKPYRRLT